MDVSLERGEERVACEVSVTTAPDHELGNIQKCLASGYGLVLWLTSERKARGRMRRLAEKELEEGNLRKVRFLLPEEFVDLLDQLGAESAGGERTVRGYRVKVQYKPVGQEETESRKQAIAETVWKAMRRMKKGRQQRP